MYGRRPSSSWCAVGVRESCQTVSKKKSMGELRKLLLMTKLIKSREWKLHKYKTEKSHNAIKNTIHNIKRVKYDILLLYASKVVFIADLDCIMF